MKVIHIESGLGNQMLSYCEYLAMKKANPEDTVFIENIIYEIPECNDIICQWNGYELERIFGIKAPNIKDYFSKEEWASIISEIRKSEFWLRNWNYPVHFTNALNNAGLNLKNIRGDFENSNIIVAYDRNRKSRFIDRFKKNDWYIYMRYIKDRLLESRKKDKINNVPKLFIHSDYDLFTGQQLLFKNIHSGIEEIAQDIRNAFVFPEYSDVRNYELEKVIQSCNSVAIHARRGDMLGVNYPYYRFGYFTRAIKYIRRHVDQPVFFIFCDPESVSWAKVHGYILGLDFEKDKVFFVDWNKGEESFRDMQLMAQCKHQVITKSSFGWWGAWLNNNPDKITISPSCLINTTKNC